jgi:hypothetical protein
MIIPELLFQPQGNTLHTTCREALPLKGGEILKQLGDN